MPCFYADHVRVFVVPEVGHVFRLLDPRVPNYGIGKIVLLDSHLSPRHDVRYNVFLRRVLVDAVRPLANSHDVPRLLVDRPFARLVDERAALQPRYLAPSYIRNFEIRVQQHVKAKRRIFTGIVDCNVEVELFLAENQSVR